MDAWNTPCLRPRRRIRTSRRRTSSWGSGVGLGSRAASAPRRTGNLSRNCHPTSRNAPSASSGPRRSSPALSNSWSYSTAARSTSALNSASREAKCAYTVWRETPAVRAMSSMLASGLPVSTWSPASRIASTLRRASDRRWRARAEAGGDWGTPRTVGLAKRLDKVSRFSNLDEVSEFPTADWNILTPPWSPCASGMSLAAFTARDTHAVDTTLIPYPALALVINLGGEIAVGSAERPDTSHGVVVGLAPRGVAGTGRSLECLQVRLSP